MLITSREQHRWVVPKGNPIKGLNQHETAAVEAFEEAGVSGIPCPTPLGEYYYIKRRSDGTTRNVTVALFPLAYQNQAKTWPEQDERDTRWFDLDGASDAVDEPDLKALIRDFRVPANLPRVADLVPPKGSRDAKRTKLAVVRWLRKLMPEHDRSFALIKARAEALVDGAEALALLLQDGDTTVETAGRADRSPSLDLRLNLAPPDRGAIPDLIGTLGRAIDRIDAAAKTIQGADLKLLAPQMRDMSGIIVEAARVTADTIPLLRYWRHNTGRLHDLTGRLTQLADDGADIRKTGVAALATSDRQHRTVKADTGRDIYSSLQRIVDVFADIARLIEGSIDLA